MIQVEDSQFQTVLFSRYQQKIVLIYVAEDFNDSQMITFK